MVVDVFAYLIGIIITAPMLATWGVYYAAAGAGRNKWKAVHTAVNWTTFLYILAVTAMLYTIYGSGYAGITSVLLMTLFTVIIVVRWKMFTEVVFHKAFKIFWRICFLLFAGLYCLLAITGIIRNSYSTTTDWVQWSVFYIQYVLGIFTIVKGACDLCGSVQLNYKTECTYKRLPRSKVRHHAVL